MKSEENDEKTVGCDMKVNVLSWLNKGHTQFPKARSNDQGNSYYPEVKLEKN